MSQELLDMGDSWEEMVLEACSAAELDFASGMEFSDETVLKEQFHLACQKIVSENASYVASILEALVKSETDVLERCLQYKEAAHKKGTCFILPK